MTYLDPDPLTVPEPDCGCAYCRTGIRDGLGHDDGPASDPPRSGAVIVYVLVALVVAGVVVWWWVR